MGENILFADIQKNEIIIGDGGRIYFVDRGRFAFNFLQGIFLLILIGIPMAVQIFFDWKRIVIENNPMSVGNILFVISFLLFVVLVCKKLIFPHRKRLRLPYKEVNLSYRSDGRSLFFVDKQGVESLICPLTEVKTRVTYSRGIRYASSHYVLSLFTGKKDIAIGDAPNSLDLRKVQEKLEKFSFVSDKNEYKVIS